MSDGAAFAAAFRDLVMPDLHQRCRMAGFCVMREQWTFVQASAFVFDLARKRGAISLSVPLLNDLEDWIDTEILRFSIEFEDPVKRKVIVDELVGRFTERQAHHRTAGTWMMK